MPFLPFKFHCRLGHPSLFLLKKPYPKFRYLSSLNYDSYQFAKCHRLSSSPQVNKLASLCSVVSQTSFYYFIAFIDDHTRLTWLYLMKNHSELLSYFCAFMLK